jgi:ATP-dependent helicase HrpA
VAKYPENPERDARHAQAVAIFWERYREREQALGARGQKDRSLEAYRWLIEELKVSLFAQELRTPFPVSYKRLEKAWKELLSR